MEECKCKWHGEFSANGREILEFIENKLLELRIGAIEEDAKRIEEFFSQHDFLCQVGAQVVATRIMSLSSMQQILFNFAFPHVDAEPGDDVPESIKQAFKNDSKLRD